MEENEGKEKKILDKEALCERLKTRFPLPFQARQFHHFEIMATCKVPIPQGSDFTLDNLPYGVFKTTGDEKAKIGVAIGDQILSLSVVKHLFSGPLMKDNQVGTILRFISFRYINLL